MKSIKSLLGIILIIGSLLPAFLSFVSLMMFFAGAAFGLVIALVFIASTIGLLRLSWFLIDKENFTLSLKHIALIVFSFCWLGFCVAIIIPNFVARKPISSVNACINNLRQIDAAANQFALERGLKTGTHIRFPDDLTPYIKLNSAGKIPTCPNGGIYKMSKVGETPTCSMSTLTPAHVLP